MAKDFNTQINEMLMKLMSGEVGGISEQRERGMVSTAEEAIDREIEEITQQIAARNAAAGGMYTGWGDKATRDVRLAGAGQKAQAVSDIQTRGEVSRGQAIQQGIGFGMRESQFGRQMHQRRKEQGSMFRGQMYGALGDLLGSLFTGGAYMLGKGALKGAGAMMNPANNPGLWPGGDPSLGWYG